MCDDPDPNVCHLQNAQPVEVFDCLNGGVVEYLGPIVGKLTPHGFAHLSSEVLLTGNNCSVAGQFRWVGNHGSFTLRNGTGALAGLHAVRGVEWLEGAIYTLEVACQFDKR